LPRFAGHAVPHIELFDRLFQRNLHAKLLRMQMKQISSINRKQSSIDIPDHHSNVRKRSQTGSHLYWLRSRRTWPNKIFTFLKTFKIFRQSKCHREQPSLKIHWKSFDLTLPFRTFSRLHHKTQPRSVQSLKNFSHKKTEPYN